MYAYIYIYVYVCIYIYIYIYIHIRIYVGQRLMLESMIHDIKPSAFLALPVRLIPY